MVKPKPTPKRVPVSRDALLARVRRQLAGTGQQLRRGRGEMGEWFILDTKANVVTETHVNLEEYARRIGAMRLWEELS